MRLRFRRFPNPRLVLPSIPDLKVHRLAIDIDSKDPSVLKEFYHRLSSVRSFLSPYSPEVHFYAGRGDAKGYHVLLLFDTPMSIRDNLALRLYLLDDPAHVAYDLYSWLYTPHFPTNVLFTSKPSKGRYYYGVCTCTLHDFLDSVLPSYLQQI